MGGASRVVVVDSETTESPVVLLARNDLDFVGMVGML